MIRDVLLREMPFVLKKRVYAVAAILGALGYALLLRIGLGEVAAYGLGMLITTAVRMLATVFKMESAESAGMSWRYGCDFYPALRFPSGRRAARRGQCGIDGTLV